MCTRQGERRGRGPSPAPDDIAISSRFGSATSSFAFGPVVFTDSFRPWRSRELRCGLLATALVFGAVACGPESESEFGSESGGEPREPGPLVDAGEWSQVGAAADPMAGHRPPEVVCPSSGWAEEFGVFEVRTEDCNYLSVEQPLARPVCAGDTLSVSLWWQSLIALEPAVGHLALHIDGELIWEHEVEIPGSSDVLSLEFPSPVDAPEGAIVNFHLHNHGQNTWTLAGFDLVGLSPTSPSVQCE